MTLTQHEPAPDVEPPENVTADDQTNEFVMPEADPGPQEGLPEDDLNNTVSTHGPQVHLDCALDGLDAAATDEVPTGTVADLIGWVGSDPARAAAALDAERAAEQPRTTLIAALEPIAAQPQEAP